MSTAEYNLLLNLFNVYILKTTDQRFFTSITKRFLDFMENTSRKRGIKLAVSYYKFMTKYFLVIKSFPRFVSHPKWFRNCRIKARYFEERVSDVNDKKVFRQYLLIDSVNK